MRRCHVVHVLGFSRVFMGSAWKKNVVALLAYADAFFGEVDKHRNAVELLQSAESCGAILDVAETMQVIKGALDCKVFLNQPQHDLLVKWFYEKGKTPKWIALIIGGLIANKEFKAQLERTVCHAVFEVREGEKITQLMKSQKTWSREQIQEAMENVSKWHAADGFRSQDSLLLLSMMRAANFYRKV